MYIKGFFSNMRDYFNPLSAYIRKHLGFEPGVQGQLTILAKEQFFF